MSGRGPPRLERGLPGPQPGQARLPEGRDVRPGRPGHTPIDRRRRASTRSWPLPAGGRRYPALVEHHPRLGRVRAWLRRLNRQLFIASLASGLLITGPLPALSSATTTTPTCKVLKSVKTNLTLSPLSVYRKKGRRYIAQIPAPTFVPSSTIGPKEPTTFPAPFTKAEMDAAEARGKAMQKQMMDRKIAEDAKNTAPRSRQGCLRH